MDVYVVLLRDRHTDPQVSVHATKHAAVHHAIDLVVEYKQHLPERLREQLTSESRYATDWVYFQFLSNEGDYVRVEKLPVLDQQETNDDHRT